MTIDWVVDKSGFIAGDDINIHGSIQNDSKQTVTGSSVTLYMVGLNISILLLIILDNNNNNLPFIHTLLNFKQFTKVRVVSSL